MGKELSQMSLEELWQLFPIYLTAHEIGWEGRYAEEAAYLKSRLPKTERISHIGSTAVPDIWAKPIIDILVEIPKDCGFLDYKKAIMTCGYCCMGETSGGLSFNKGYTENGFADKVFHLHLRRVGDNRELYFRDYLIEHPETAKEYEGLKLKLWKEFEHNRDAYTNAKTQFVQKYTDMAKRLYQNRY